MANSERISADLRAVVLDCVLKALDIAGVFFYALHRIWMGTDGVVHTTCVEDQKFVEAANFPGTVDSVLKSLLALRHTRFDAEVVLSAEGVC